MTKKDQFFDVLKNIFVGAKIEGDSGYVNLMRIKSIYYNEFKYQLLIDIAQKLNEVGQNFETEMYNKLYTFFKKYFSESGAIYFSYTPLQEKIYERIYRDDKDVMLFWKTQMLYYVKTEQLFKNMEVQDEGITYFFSVAELEHKKSNEKKELVFELEKTDIEKGWHIYLNVKYATNGTKTKIDDIVAQLKKTSGFKQYDHKRLEKALNVFKRQSEIDYFINKDAKSFLREQFSLWIKGYLLDDESLFEVERLKQLKALQYIAFHIIDLVSQFEDELVKIWNKPKFAHSSNYVITLDKIAERDFVLLEKILAHEGMQAQIQEWQDLGIATETFSLSAIFETDLEGKKLKKEWRYLPLDTRFVKEWEMEILALFDDLDNQLDGWLIHSENYQALNTVQHKFQEKVQTIYIDPPYNTNNDEFIYNDGYKSASWLSLMSDRLYLGKSFLSKEGTTFMSLDDNEQSNFKKLNDEIWGINNFIGQFVWRKKVGAGADSKYFFRQHEYILSYAKELVNIEELYQPLNEKQLTEYDNPDSDMRGKWAATDLSSPAHDNDPKRIYEVVSPSGKTFKKCWSYTAENFKQLEKDNLIWWGKDNNAMPKRKRFLADKKGLTPRSWIDFVLTQDGKKDLGNLDFSYPKPVELITHFLQIGTVAKKNALILDYFGGSGTTAEAVISLNKKDKGQRKYLLCEMGAHFHSVIVPRLKKVSFTDNWKEGKAQAGQGYSHFFKYYALEQYEETLSKVKYADKNPVPTQDIYHQYLFLKDLKLSEAVLHLDETGDNMQVDLTQLHAKIDIPETLSHLLGKFIKQIRKDEVVFTDGTSIDLRKIDYKVIKPLIWW